MRSSRCRRVWLVILVIGMAFVWGHSMIPASGSAEESRIVGEIIKPFLEIFVGEGNVTDHLVRKLAHFTEYGVLGFAMGANVALRGREAVKTPQSPVGDSSPLGEPRNRIYRWTYGLLLMLAIAVVDESIQIVTPGRGAMVADVLLDMCGSLAGLLAALAVCACWRRLTPQSPAKGR